MLFNSIEFAVFLPIVFMVYWFVASRHLRLQNALVLAASYVFYGWWDWRFLSLIVISSSVDYGVGLGLARFRDPRARKTLLAVSLVVNLGLLGFFKYFNFFVDSLVGAFEAMGIQLHPRTLQVILPVGISFYTFQTLSYTIDVFRGRFQPTRDAIAFFAFVAFFPQLVAGPIERAYNLLPQFQRPRAFDPGRATDGLRQILYGLFKKIVIADGCAVYVDQIFANYQSLDGASLLLGTVYFAFQIYADFSGYSDIAIGAAKLLGFSLMTNFAFPYFSRDIAEFWRRWHISLSTWFRDYLFIPLGGSRGSKWFNLRNILVTFTVSGLWHGANWTFVVWGLLNGLYYAPLLALDRQRVHRGPIAEGRWLPGLREGMQILTTFALTLVAWVFFRAESLGHAAGYLAHMFSPSLFSVPLVAKGQLPWLVGFVIFEWIQRNRRHAFQIGGLPWAMRWIAYWLLGFATLASFQGENSFIYFQF